jgi:hypothetical protein
MIHRNEDEFSKELRDSCGADCADKLKGKLIPVEFLLEEITLIDWALTAFTNEPLYQALGQAAESLGSQHVSLTELETPLREAFDRVQGFELVMERLRRKLSNAVNTKLELDGNQPEFKF